MAERLLDGRGVGSFSVRTVNDGVNASYPDQQLLTLTVPTGVSAGVITVSTAGGTSTLRTGAAATLTALPDLTPAADVGDTLATATNLPLSLNQSQQIQSGVGTQLDVDLYRVDLSAGEQLALDASTDYFAHLRMFDSSGHELSGSALLYYNNPTALAFVAPASGSYYIGISGYGNNNYNPSTANSGTASGYTYGYTLNIKRQLPGTSSLAAITTTASSGTPTNTGVASANTGQTLTVTGLGLGLLATDRIVFTTLDDNGYLGETIITPTTVAADGMSLTVVVPTNATTGRVRLARDAATVGILLQIVPSISGFTPNGATAANLSGSAFAEGATTVLFPTAQVDDIGRNYGVDVYNANTGASVSHASGISRSSVRVRTIGGTSAAFATGQP